MNVPSATSISNSREGYIYVLSNPIFIKSMYKIGRTQRDPKNRATEIFNSSPLPIPFNLEYQVKVENVILAESIIFISLQQFRINPRREFFKIDLDELIKIIESVPLVSNCRIQLPAAPLDTLEGFQEFQ